MVTVKGNVAEFRFFRPQARQVCVVGDFNNWKPAQILMSRDGEGYWTSYVHLQPGTFKFRYWADGQWFTDFAAFGVEYGPFGFDGIVQIEPPVKGEVRQAGPASRAGAAVA